ncbi:RNA-directed DNA polymerase, eukaryota [Tanacetum coccineum]
MVEPEKPVKKKDQIALDEELALRLHAEEQATTRSPSYDNATNAYIINCNYVALAHDTEDLFINDSKEEVKRAFWDCVLRKGISVLKVLKQGDPLSPVLIILIKRACIHRFSYVDALECLPSSGLSDKQVHESWREYCDVHGIVPLLRLFDRHVWSLENSGEFSVASIQKVIDEKRFPGVNSLTRWVKSMPIKVNIIAWKIITDALPTRFNFSRRGIEIDSIACPICNGGVESTNHLFFQCSLVRQIARKISSWWNVIMADVTTL